MPVSQRSQFSGWAHREWLTFAALLALLLTASPSAALAHGGDTDSQGGHRDNMNASGLGAYHFHHGMGPHLHPNGVCPYSGDTNAGQAIGASSSGESPCCLGLVVLVVAGGVYGLGRLANRSITAIEGASAKREAKKSAVRIAERRPHYPVAGVGRVKWFREGMGDGIIETECGDHLYVHFSEIMMEGYKVLQEGQAVEFLADLDHKGHVVATKVRVVR